MAAGLTKGDALFFVQLWFSPRGCAFWILASQRISNGLQVDRGGERPCAKQAGAMGLALGSGLAPVRLSFIHTKKAQNALLLHYALLLHEHELGLGSLLRCAVKRRAPRTHYT
jgi:hypothetical protein